jgi:hypothetical protein
VPLQPPAPFMLSFRNNLIAVTREPGQGLRAYSCGQAVSLVAPVGAQSPRDVRQVGTGDPDSGRHVPETLGVKFTKCTPGFPNPHHLTGLLGRQRAPAFLTATPSFDCKIVANLIFFPLHIVIMSGLCVSGNQNNSGEIQTYLPNVE